MFNVKIALLLPLTLAQVAVASLIPSIWTSSGCFKDDSTARQLDLARQTSSTMTIKKCQAFCFSKEATFAGLEYGVECWCDHAIRSLELSDEVPIEECNMPCAGNANQKCGGRNRVEIYYNPAHESAGPFIRPESNGYVVTECRTDSVASRTLPVRYLAKDLGKRVDVRSCTKACRTGGYKYAGVEFGAECFCGNELSSTSREAEYYECFDMPCEGNKREICGGRDRLLLYT